MSDDDRRSAERTPSLTLLQYTPSATEAAVPQITRTLDLSPGGAKVELDAALPLGAQLAFQLQVGETLVSGQAQVVHLLLGSSGRVEAGIQFLELDPDAAEAIRGFLDG